MDDNDRAVLLVLVGIPGSGKSTWARQFVQTQPGYRVVSTDQIRADLFGDDAIQGDWAQIWPQVQSQWQQGMKAIRQGQLRGMIYDATNCRRHYRRQVLALARQLGFNPVILCWFDVPLSLGLQRNRRRSRQVPEAIIESMFRQLQGAPPATSEGVDQIIRITNAASD